MYTYFQSNGNLYTIKNEIIDLDSGFWLKVSIIFLCINSCSALGFAQFLCFDSDQRDSGFKLPDTFIL
jgi:hypothetical protein